ncbi:hypothetical protein Dsin_003647 [Dipteronia sinensis]|uniref:Uncharacterized protein n=1 Tax=Dipteronia sinensis TaxID=43782 RepID=A0AAE0B8H0_9ROSI|nr:hypothetical protein Dsin_003647 [Dipteronia sinensis]
MPKRSTRTGSNNKVLTTKPSKNGPYPSHGLMGQHCSDIPVPDIGKQLSNAALDVQDMAELERRAFRVQHATLCYYFTTD